jgi:hypothetical protein
LLNTIAMRPLRRLSSANGVWLEGTARRTGCVQCAPSSEDVARKSVASPSDEKSATNTPRCRTSAGHTSEPLCAEPPMRVCRTPRW